jgi:hypothetical protein
MSARRLPPLTRFAARVYTGPLGHLYGGVLDWVELVAKLTLARARASARRALAGGHRPGGDARGQRS